MRKPANDSIAGRIASAQADQRHIEVPEGLGELTSAEEIAWNQYISARNEWKANELRALFEVVKTETRINQIREEAENTPFTYETGTDPGNITHKPHPIHAELRSEQNALKGYLRLIGLQLAKSAANSIADEGKKHTGRGKKKASVSLLAQ
jgi:hypothetical protein